MSMSTLNLLSGLLTPDFLRTAARATGESESSVSKALGAAFPAVLGALVQGAGNSVMMNGVADMIKNPAIAALLGPGGGVLGSVGSLLAPNASAGPVGTVAQSLLGALFGKNIGAVASAIGSLAGLKGGGSAASLINLAAPMVLAALGNRLGKSLTGTALAVLLGQEKNGIMSAIPDALSGVLGAMSAPSTAAPSAPAPATTAAARAPSPTPAAAPTGAAVPEVTPRQSTVVGSLIGLLLTFAIIAGVVFALSQCKKAAASGSATKFASLAHEPNRA